MNSLIQIDYRCQCGKLLFRGMVFRSAVEVKCPRCNRLNSIEGISVVKNPNRFSILTTQKGKIVKNSKSIESALGYKHDELMGENVEKIFSDSAMAKTDRIFAKKIIGKKYLRLDAVCRKKNGDTLQVSICYRHIFVNEGELFLRTIDIVPEIDKKLVDETNFDFANFCDIVTETDENGNIIYLDKNLKDITGFNPEDLIGIKVDNLLFGAQKDMRSKNYKMLRARKKSYRTIPGYQVKGKSGEIFEQEVFCTPFYDDAGNFMGFRNMHWLKKMAVDN